MTLPLPLPAYIHYGWPLVYPEISKLLSTRQEIRRSNAAFSKKRLYKKGN